MASLSTTYLLVYNTIQTLLWYKTFFQLLPPLLLPQTYPLTQIPPPLLTAQNLAPLEFLHVLLNLSRGSPLQTLTQIAGRNAVLFLVIQPCLSYLLNNHIGYLAVLATITAWTLVEIVRYPFYIITITKPEPNSFTRLIIWLRYSVFVVLYPLGFVGEWACYYVALPLLEEKEMWSMKLPNSWNWAFDFGVFVRVLLVLYLVGAPMMFKGMWKLRMKKLGSGESGGGGGGGGGTKRE